MRRMIMLAAFAISVSGCAEAAGPRPGEAAVYDRITSETNCESLQAEFDQAMSNVGARPSGDSLRTTSLAYAKAADARMRSLGCYE
jgi:hypothetical protein